MKTIKTTAVLLFFALFVLQLSQCKKETIYEKMSFGDTQTDLLVDSVYKASSDGFLSVDFTIPVNSSTLINIYSDTSKNPTKIIASMSTQSMTTVAIQKGRYWKVHRLQTGIDLGKILISWTPIE